jgi:hypothetical protein
MKPIFNGTSHAARRERAIYQIHTVYQSALSVVSWVDLCVNLLDKNNDARIYLHTLSSELLLSITELTFRATKTFSIRRINKYTEEIRSDTRHVIDEVSRLKLNEEHPQFFRKEVLMDRANKGNFESEETDNTSK